jgi:hypothetical protein
LGIAGVRVQAQAESSARNAAMSEPVTLEIFTDYV